MELNVQERLTLSRLLPEKGNFETMTAVENLRQILFLTEEEVEKVELKQTENAITWNEQGAERIEIEVSSKGKELLMSELEKLDEKEELDALQFAIFKRFKDE
jgi:hypothetical protein